MWYRFEDLHSRWATQENPHALRGQGGTAGDGLKGAPAIKDLGDGETATLFDIEGPGLIRRLWMTTHARDPHSLRNQILRIYWEGHDRPSVEAPLADFFGMAHGAPVPMYSEVVSMQEGRGLNCLIPMPFREHARIAVTNETGRPIDWFFYDIAFTLGDTVREDDGRFHARWSRQNPCPLGHDFTILETAGRGRFLGCVIGVRPLSEGWWGEGEVKMYLDDDDLYPTLCGTGLEDYIGSAWGLGEHSTAYQGAPLHRPPYTTLFRFHIPDPIYFRERIKVTVQQMGAGLRRDLEKIYGERLIANPKNHPRRSPDSVYYLRSDDYCATAYWYQWPPAEDGPALPGAGARSANLILSEQEGGT